MVEFVATGDIPKQIAAGADTVMLGSVIIGTKNPQETIYEGRKFKPIEEWDSLKR
jgi:IMP dehydrogenase